MSTSIALQNVISLTPKPNDFDTFWDKALSELDQHEPNVTLTKSTFQAKDVTCYDLTFIGVGGSKIYAKYLLPTHDTPVGAILQFHGYMYHSGEWTEKLAYVSQGYAVLAMDCRGQGGKSQDLDGSSGTTVFGHVIKGIDDGAKKLYYRQLYLDTVLLARIAMNFKEIDETNIYAMGMSQGGGLTIACAALEPRIKKIAVQNPFLSDYKYAWSVGASRENYRIMDYFRLYDPIHEREHEIFSTLGYIAVEHLAPRIQAHVLFGVGLKDDVCPPHCQFAIYNQIQSNKQLKVYPDYAHEQMYGFSDMTTLFFNE